MKIENLNEDGTRQTSERDPNHRHHHHHPEPHIILLEEEAAEPVEPLPLGWRTWLVVFTAGFLAIFVQIYTSVAAPSTIAFIVQDLGDQAISGWVIQAPLLMQAVLCPILGRLSDVLDRKTLVTVTPLIALVGSIISAKASSMSMLIAGNVLVGIVLGTLGIVQTIPAEILPLKYRAISNGISFLGGSIGGTVGGFAGGAFCRAPGGWRNMFWVQAGLNGCVSICLFLFYWPRKNMEFPKMNIQETIWACDPIGCLLYIGGATLSLMGLNWSSGAYPWDDTHVAVPLAIGLFFLLLFGLYEWKGRSDGLCAHIFFKAGRNFPLALFSFTVEGWMYYSAVNTITTQMPLYLGWQSDSLLISVRQLYYTIPTTLASVFIIWYSTRFKEIKIPLVVCFILFLATACTYAGTQADWKDVQLGLNVLAGIGQAGPLTLLIVAIQFTAPHAYLSTATGLAFSFRAIGGAFGSAVLYTIINGHVVRNYNKDVTTAAVRAGLPAQDVPILLQVMAQGNGPPTKEVLAAVLSQALPAASMTIIIAAQQAAYRVYAKAYGLAWASIIPFVVIAIVCCALLKAVSQLMTEKVEAPVEKPQHMLEEKCPSEGGV